MLVSFSSLQETSMGSDYSYTCQHGPNECVGNLIEVRKRPLHISGFTFHTNIILYLLHFQLTINVWLSMNKVGSHDCRYSSFLCFSPV